MRLKKWLRHLDRIQLGHSIGRGWGWFSVSSSGTEQPGKNWTNFGKTKPVFSASRTALNGTSTLYNVRDRWDSEEWRIIRLEDFTTMGSLVSPMNSYQMLICFKTGELLGNYLLKRNLEVLWFYSTQLRSLGGDRFKEWEEGVIEEGEAKCS